MEVDAKAGGSGDLAEMKRAAAARGHVVMARQPKKAMRGSGDFDRVLRWTDPTIFTPQLPPLTRRGDLQEISLSSYTHSLQPTRLSTLFPAFSLLRRLPQLLSENPLVLPSHRVSSRQLRFVPYPPSIDTLAGFRDLGLLERLLPI